MKTIRLAAVGAIFTSFLFGCTSYESSGDSATLRTDTPQPRYTTAQQPTPVAASVTSDGRTSLAFPTGDRATSVVAVDRVAPTEWTAGQAYDYDLHVTNLTSVALNEVVLVERTPANLKISGSTPDATSRNDGELRWAMGSLGPRETRSVRIRATAAARAEDQAAATARECISVTYVPWACVPVQVVQPMLELVASAPAEVLLCERIPVKYTVTNRGTGAARNVVIRHALPTGVAPRGSTAEQLEARVESLAPGESRSFVANVNASKTGRYTQSIAAAADGGLNANATASTVVREPVLSIKKTGPQTLFLGRDFSYDIVVTNIGDGDARDAVVEDTLPGNAQLVSATGGGTSANGKISWNLGTLKPRDARKVTVTLRVEQATSVVNTATARAQCAAEVSSTITTAVRGVPAILLEVVDDPDPIPVGGEVTYTIRVTNQGSATGTNIKITAGLEDTMQFVSATGQTPGSASGQNVAFAALKSLAPKAAAEWKVVVKAVKTGDVRFRVEMNSDQLERPVTETEASNFYQ
ncbi:MAG: DUF11 domain-containing protein [Phycisphaeraceae bacterium]|nr:DUF11 domain-containing protein [Phycisphaeraceae bacterium]